MNILSQSSVKSNESGMTSGRFDISNKKNESQNFNKLLMTSEKPSHRTSLNQTVSSFKPQQDEKANNNSTVHPEGKNIFEEIEIGDMIEVLSNLVNVNIEKLSDSSGNKMLDTKIQSIISQLEKLNSNLSEINGNLGSNTTQKIGDLFGSKDITHSFIDILQSINTKLELSDIPKLTSIVNNISNTIQKLSEKIHTGSVINENILKSGNDVGINNNDKVSSYKAMQASQEHLQKNTDVNRILNAIQNLNEKPKRSLFNASSNSKNGNSGAQTMTEFLNPIGSNTKKINIVNALQKTFNNPKVSNELASYMIEFSDRSISDSTYSRNNNFESLLKQVEQTIVNKTISESNNTPKPLFNNILNQLNKSTFNGNKLSVSLKPSSLGELSINIDVDKDGVVKAVIRAENPVVLETMRNDRHHLISLLKESGVNINPDSLDFEQQDSQSNNDREENSSLTNQKYDGDETDVPADANQSIITDNTLDILT